MASRLRMTEAKFSIRCRNDPVFCGLLWHQRVVCACSSTAVPQD
jgi:hypothetical protein